MQELLTALTGEVLANLASNPAVPLLIAALVFAIVLVAILSVARRFRNAVDATISFDAASSQPGLSQPGLSQPAPLGSRFRTRQQVEPPSAQPWEERREDTLRALDSAARGFGRFYIILLCLLEAAATGLIVLVYLKAPQDANRAFILMYAGVAYVLAVAWLTSQLFTTLRRISPPRDYRPGLSPKINVTFNTAPEVHKLDDEALDRAQRYMEGGATLDDTCALIVPQFRSMPGPLRLALRAAIQTALDQRRKK